MPEKAKISPLAAAMDLCQQMDTEMILDLLQGYIQPERRDQDMLKAIFSTLKQRVISHP